jgi:hypothetical protein
MFFAPLEGWRHIKVTGRRTAVDYAHALKDLADRHFPKPKKSFWCRTISTPMSELAVLSKQCLDRCIKDLKILKNEIAAWKKIRNKHRTKAN